MTILPPPTRPPWHECSTPAPLRRESGGVFEPAHQDSTLWECPACGRWWKYGGHPNCYATANDPFEWAPVRWYDIPARRRIATHETEKMHYRVPTVVGDLHWWHCHPNPNRGRP